MAKSASYYSVDDFNNYKRTQGKCLPPRTNVLAAASYIQVLFDSKKLTYGFFGGLPMLCLGYKRDMPDIHVAYDEKDFERLKAKLESDRRVQLQIGMNPLLPFKILVWTGPSHNDYGCTVDATIELDLVPSGSCGSPAASVLSQNLILLGLQTANGKQIILKSLNMQYLMATLLSYCKARDLLWDPRKDILYLCKCETEEVQRIRGRLNKREVKELFLGTSFFSQLSMDDQRLCYRTLLDTEPPPSMAITPPAAQALAYPQVRSTDPEQSSDARSPRLRYRKVKGQRSSSSGTPDHQVAKGPRSQSIEYLKDSGSFSYIQGAQCVYSAKPHAAIATERARKSMPNMGAIHDTPPTLRAGTRDTSGLRIQERERNSSHVGHSHNQLQNGSQPVRASSNPESEGCFQRAYVKTKDEVDNADRAFKPGLRTPTSSSMASTTKDSTCTAVHGIHSQRGSSHVVSPEREQAPRQQYFEKTNAPPRGRLHLVGSEGILDAPKKPQKTEQVQAEHQRHRSAPPPQTQPAFVFELDATAPLDITFVAELPADFIAPSSAEQNVTRNDEATRHQSGIQPSTVRTSSAPLEHDSLPANLVAGRPGLRSNHLSFSHPDSSNEPTPIFSARQTNAYRYSSYVLPSSVGPEASPGWANAHAYKAYRPVVVTGELNRSDSVSSVYSPGHKRNDSDDSTASHDSTKLAKEYQQLLNFEEGYGSGRRSF